METFFYTVAAYATKEAVNHCVKRHPKKVKTVIKTVKDSLLCRYPMPSTQGSGPITTRAVWAK